MGQPVHYWNKMPFAPGLYQASVGDKLSFLFNTEHTVWLMPSADASASCDFSGAVELAGPTYGLPDWPELGSGDTSSARQTGLSTSPPAPRGPARPPRHPAITTRPTDSTRATRWRSRRSSAPTGSSPRWSGGSAGSRPTCTRRSWRRPASSTLRAARARAVGPAAAGHARRAFKGDGQRVRRGGHAQPAAAVAAAAAARTAARAAASTASAAVAAAVAAGPPPPPPAAAAAAVLAGREARLPGAVHLGCRDRGAALRGRVHDRVRLPDRRRQRLVQARRGKDAPKPDEIDAPEREVQQYKRKR